MAEVGGKTGKPTNDGPNCSPCQKGGDTFDASGYCCECREYLCKNCLNVHRRLAATNRHQVLEGDDMPTSIPESSNEDSVVFETCSIHRQTKEPVKFYCPTHNEFGCGDCIVLSHRTCKVEYISDVARGFKDSEEYKSLLTNISDFERRLRRIEERNCNVKEKNERDISAAIENLLSFKDEILNYVNTKVQELLSALEKAKNEDTQLLTDMKRQTESTKDKIRKMKLEFESMQNDAINLFKEVKRNKTNLKEIEVDVESLDQVKIKRAIVKFEREEELDKLLKRAPSLGNITTEDYLDMSQTEFIPDHDLNIIGDGDYLECDITGIAAFENDLLVLADWNNKAIKVVNKTTSKIVARHQLSEHPWDLSVLQHNKEIAVTSFDSPTIWILAYKDNNLKKVRKLSVTGRPYGIDSKDGKLAVGFHQPDKVEVMDTKGTVIHRITNYQIDGYMGYIAFTHDGNGLYVNFKNNSVGKLSLDGTCLTTYSDNDLNTPQGLAVTRDGSLLVCGFWSHNIHVVSAECEKVRIVLFEKDGLKYPRSVYLCEEKGLLYVACVDEHVLKVFKAV